MRVEEWAQQAVRSKRMSEWCKQVNNQTSKWSSSNFLILGHSEPLCIGRPGFSPVTGRYLSHLGRQFHRDFILLTPPGFLVTMAIQGSLVAMAIQGIPVAIENRFFVCHRRIKNSSIIRADEEIRSHNREWGCPLWWRPPNVLSRWESVAVKLWFMGIWQGNDYTSRIYFTDRFCELCLQHDSNTLIHSSPRCRFWNWPVLKVTCFECDVVATLRIFFLIQYERLYVIQCACLI